MGWHERLLESATSLSGIDIFVFLESVDCVLCFSSLKSYEKHAKILL